MNKMLLVMALIFGGAAHAELAPKWQRQLEDYRTLMATSNTAGVYIHMGLDAGIAAGTCTLSAIVTEAAFISDTIPLTNVLSETLANVTNPQYQTYQNLLEWENLSAIGRGTVGGAPVAVLDTLRFIGLWLGGNEDQAWQGVKKTYASTMATYNAVFAEQGQCLMSVAKVMIARAELKRREENVPSPLRVPLEIPRP